MKLDMKLYDYQEEGVNQMIAFGSCIQADDMGLGKTAQTITAVDRLNAYPCLVICPASLKLNWEKEIELWTKKKGLVLNDNVKNTYPMFFEANVSQFFIVNFESLRKFFVKHIPKKNDVKLSDIVFHDTINFFKSIIIDESHNVKEVSAMQTKLTAGICYGKKHVFALSGTPVMNRTTELAPQLLMINKMHLFGGYLNFMNDFEAPSEKKLEELQKTLTKNCMIRREKGDVLELKEKTRQIVFTELSNQEEYDFALNDLRGYLAEIGKTPSEINRSMRGEVMVRIGLLRKLAGLGKIQSVKEHLFLLRNRGEKVVLFGENKEVLDEFKQIKGAVVIVGGMSANDKQSSVNKFQNDSDTWLAVCSLKAAGVGVTLTKGRITAFIQMGWHSAIQDQAEDRQYRIGQKKDVHCLYYIAPNTIDYYTYNVIEKKRELCSKVMGAADDIEWETISDILSLI